MSRDRALLHRHKLQAFAAYCTAQGWIEEPCQGAYEALRMFHRPTKKRLYVHQSGRETPHVTVWGQSLELAQAFISAAHRAKHPPVQEASDA